MSDVGGAGARVRPRCPAMWESLLIGGVTGLVALSGVFYTQWRADQREDHRLDRDDAARSYDHRRDAYMTFLTDFMAMTDLLWRRENEPFEGDRDPEPPEDLLAPLFRRIDVIHVFGTGAAFVTATKALETLSRWVFGSAERPASWDDVEEARLAFVAQIRRDLRVSDK